MPLILSVLVRDVNHRSTNYLNILSFLYFVCKPFRLCHTRMLVWCAKRCQVEGVRKVSKYLLFRTLPLRMKAKYVFHFTAGMESSVILLRLNFFLQVFILDKQLNIGCICWQVVSNMYKTEFSVRCTDFYLHMRRYVECLFLTS